MSLIKTTTNENIRIFFVKDDKNSSSEDNDMKSASNICKQLKLKTYSISEEKAMKQEFNKTDVIVLKQFSGNFFDNLFTKNCLVVGPKCLHTCISQKVSIPFNDSPVFNTAMVGVVATASKMPQGQKENLAKYVKFMGGKYINKLTKNVTHLITDVGHSPKFEKSIDNEINIMYSSWVKEVWDASFSKDVKATDEEFLKYRIPPFFQMNISSSNLPKATKLELKSIIESNGGVYMPALEHNKTSILIIGEPDGKKFQYAQVWGIPCYKPTWIYDSAKKGQALKSEIYLVSSKPKCSTPTSELPTFMSNSEISVVPLAQDTTNNQINETDSIASSSCFGQQQQQQPTPVLKSYRTESRKLFDDKPTGANGKKAVRNEGEDITKNNDPTNEQLSKKLFIPLVNEPQRSDQDNQPVKTKSHNEANNLQGQKETCSDVKNADLDNFSDESIDVGPIFEGLTFSISGLDDITTVVDLIKSLNGNIVTKKFNNKVDYTIVPIINNLDSKGNHVVTVLWVEDCYEQHCIVPIEYYHQPISLNAGIEPLAGSVLCISGFASKERTFIAYLTSTLGANVQDAFSKKDHPEKNLLKSTHLVCLSPFGPKYDAAVKWGVPVLGKEWVLSICTTGQISDLNLFTSTNKNLTGHINNNEVSNDQKITPPVNPDIKRVTDAIPSIVKTTPCVPKAKVYEVKIPPETSTHEIALDKPFTSCNTFLAHNLLPQNEIPHTKDFPQVTPKIALPVNPVLKRVAEMTPPGPCTPKSKKIDEVNFLPETPVSTYLAPETLRNTAGTPEICNDRMTTPDNVQRKLSVTSCGKSPFHINTPNTPYGQVFMNDGEIPSPSTRKRWKNWIDQIPELHEGSPEVQSFRKHRPSTPLNVIMKQLLVKFGGASIDGIDHVTGDLLPNGPYKEWAHENETLKVDTPVIPVENLPNNTSWLSKDTPSKNDKSKKKRLFSGDMGTPLSNNGSPGTQNVSKTQDATKCKPSISWGSVKKSYKDVEVDEMSVWDFGQPNALSFLGLENIVEHKTKKIKLSGTNRDAPEQSQISETKDLQKKENIVLKPTPVFVLTNILGSTREKCEEIIKSLGGEVSQSFSFDFRSTHLVMEKPIRSEKLLCSIARGIWILHISYLIQSFESKTFLPEEDFEWGNERSKNKLPNLEPGTETDLAIAAHRWRIERMNESEPNAFKSFKVVVVTTQNKIGQYQRILEAGGATILDTSNILNATHVIWDERTSLPVSRALLSNNNIYLLKPVYLGDYLTKSPPPDPKNYSLF